MTAGLSDPLHHGDLRQPRGEGGALPALLVHAGRLHRGPGHCGHLRQGRGRVPAQSHLCPDICFGDGVHTSGGEKTVIHLYVVSN